MSDIILPSGIIVPGTAGKWQPTDKTTEHVLDLVAPDESWHGFVKSDGCAHVYQRTEITGPLSEHDCVEECDYWHICNLDDFINRMAALREAAKKHFGEGWE